MEKEVIIYTTPICPFCQRAKKYFDMKGVKYKEVDVSVYRDIAEKLNIRGVPYIKIGDNYVEGFNVPLINKYLNL